MAWRFQQRHQFIYRRQPPGVVPRKIAIVQLLKEALHREDFCLEPVFNRDQKWLWSSDRRSYTAAWYVNVEMGFVAWQDTSGLFYARGVCENLSG